MSPIPNTSSVVEATGISTSTDVHTNNSSSSRNNGDATVPTTTTTVVAVTQLPPSPPSRPIPTIPPPPLTTTTIQQPQPQTPPPLLIRKYLCFAPRPEEWDKYCTMILQSKAVTKASIVSTLQHLYELHPQFQCYFNTTTLNNDNDDDSKKKHHITTTSHSHNEIPTTTTATTVSSLTTKTTSASSSNSNNSIPQLRRTGPGRKSNAEYAIQFYEYILQQFHPIVPTTTITTTSGSIGMMSDNHDGLNHHDDIDDATSKTQVSTTLNDEKSIIIMTTPNVPNLNDDNHNDKKVAAQPSENVPQQVSSTTTTTVSKVQDTTPENVVKQNTVCEVCCQSITTTTTSASTTLTRDTATPPVVPCATCPKIFHTSCVRPKWDTSIVEPTDRPHHTTIHTDTDTTSNSHSDWMITNYKCAYCIMATYKRNDKHRKQAAAAVRFMARLRKQHEQSQQQLSSSQRRKEISTLPTTTVTTTTTTTTSESENDIVMEDVIEDSNDDDDNVVMKEEDKMDVQENDAIIQQHPPAEEEHEVEESKPPANASSATTNEKKVKAEQELSNQTETMATDTNPTDADDDGTSKLENDPTSNNTATMTTFTTDASSSSSSPARSSRRCRKQPTLYNPQDGPASRWQTDELTEWKLQRAKEEEEEEAKIQALKASELSKEAASSSSRMANNNNVTLRKALRHERKEGGVICNFCLDDPNIPVCVFCACRVCFGKHCQNELLLCDNCDEEYHIFCLNPPLTCVPAPNQSWYCVNCSKRDEQDVSTRLSRRVSVDTTKSISAPSDTTDNVSPSSRRSLRSPKLSTAALQMLSSVKETTYEKIVPPAAGTNKNVPKKSVTKPMKRPRGRPPKSDASTPGTTTHLMNSGSEHSTDGTINPPISKVPKYYASTGNTENPIKRRPGRPPTKSTEIVMEGKPKSSMQQSLSGRKRGRPPSAETLAKRAKLEAMARKAARQYAKSIFTSSQSTVAASAPTQLSVNKKSSSEFTTAMSVTATTTPTAANDNINDTSAVASPIIVSRSGRTVRRSNFHDELAETEQHLKTLRSNNEKNGNPTPSPRNTGYTTATNATAPSLTNDSAPRLSENKLSISIHSTAGIASGPPTISSQTAGSVATEQNDSVYLFDSSSMKMPAKDFASASTLNNNADHGGYDDNESFDQDEMSATYNIANQNVHDGISELQPTTNSTGTTLEQPLQSQHQSQISLDGLKQPRRKPGARECMQISRRFGVKEIPQQYMDTLLDYCNRGKVEHLIRMRERLDEHSRFLEMQLAGLESLVLEHGESDIVVPLAPPSPDRRHE